MTDLKVVLELQYEGKKVYCLYIDGVPSHYGPWDEVYDRYKELGGEPNV